MDEQSYLGSGARFPFDVNPATGRIEMSSGADNVKESLYLVLRTNIGERLLRPSYGTQLSSYSFMEISATTMQMLRRDLTNQIHRSEPRVGNVVINADNSQPGMLLFTIDYTIRDSNVTGNLVFPFYLDTPLQPAEMAGGGIMDYANETYTMDDMPEVIDTDDGYY